MIVPIAAHGLSGKSRATRIRRLWHTGLLLDADTVRVGGETVIERAVRRGGAHLVDGRQSRAWEVEYRTALEEGVTRLDSVYNGLVIVLTRHPDDLPRGRWPTRRLVITPGHEFWRRYRVVSGSDPARAAIAALERAALCRLASDKHYIVYPSVMTSMAAAYNNMED